MPSSAPRSPGLIASGSLRAACTLGGPAAYPRKQWHSQKSLFPPLKIVSRVLAQWECVFGAKYGNYLRNLFLAPTTSVRKIRNENKYLVAPI